MNEPLETVRSPLFCERPVKAVVWDLDWTVWDGVVLEGDQCLLRDGVLDLIAELDERGVLQSIASRGDFDAAALKLKERGIAGYFVAPQINWGSKSDSIKAIASDLNIGIDTILFIDDQEFERLEVQTGAAGTRTLATDDLGGLLDLIGERETSLKGRRRREMYIEDLRRGQSEAEFDGTREAFMQSLVLSLEVRPAQVVDLERAEELTRRTSQLNSTGLFFPREELEGMIASSNHSLMVASLKDRFGDYGTIGLILVEQRTKLWRVKLILVSCRTISRGIGPCLLNLTFQHAAARGAALEVEFRNSGRNRAMRLSLMAAGFKPLRHEGSSAIFSKPEGSSILFPSYITTACQWD